MPIKVISLSEQEVASVEDVAALQQQLASLESRVAYLESKPVPDPPDEPDPVEPPGPPDPPTGENNIDRIRVAGHPCPPLSEWHRPSPDVATVKSMLIPADLLTGVRRLYTPRDIREGDNFKLHKNVGDRGPQHLALRSHATGDASLMAQARDAYFADPFRGTVYGATPASAWARLLSLDWIAWQTPAQYEAAFLLAQQDILANSDERQSRRYPEDGLSDPNHAATSAWPMKTLLALHAYGVNPDGPSHAWAEQHINLLNSDPAETGVWNPWDFHLQLGLISRRGGGCEYGWGGTTHYSLGGYESYFTGGAIVLLYAVDTALGTDLTRSCLYNRTRWLGHAAELNPDIENRHAENFLLQMVARLLRDEPEGRKYLWLAENQRGWDSAPNYAELQSCLGPLPAVSEPPAAVQGERIGSRWHWRESPESDAFRVAFTCRDMSNFRFHHGETAFWFMIGSVGLTDPRTNRGAMVEAVSNGAWFGRRSGDPHCMNSGRWPVWCNDDPWRGQGAGRSKWPLRFLTDPGHIIGDASGPQLRSDGKWEWLLQLNGRIGADGIIGQSVTGPCSRHYLFDPTARRLEITDEYSVDAEYLGWHFSPSHPVDLSMLDIPGQAFGFDITDGSHTVQVGIKSLDPGIVLRCTPRTQWNIDGHVLGLDRHPRPNPVPMNLGFEPSQRLPTHHVKTICQVL